VAAAGSRRFAPSPAWTLVALVGLALFVSLGLWQLGRADEKRARLAGYASGGDQLLALPADFAPVERYQRLSARGRYDPSRQFLLDNMTYDGQAGFRVLTPLLLDDGRVLVVDRGFTPGFGDRSRLPEIGVDDAPREVLGRADYLPRPGIELAASVATGWPRIVGFPRIEELQEALGQPTYPQLLLLDATEPDGFVRDWQPPTLGPERHVGYAVQWFGFAVAVCVIWVLLSMRREESPP